MKTNATKLLDRARTANPGRSEGAVSHPRPGLGAVLVTWNRVTKEYDIGTYARSMATGRRSEVLPLLEKMVA